MLEPARQAWIVLTYLRGAVSGACRDRPESSRPWETVGGGRLGTVLEIATALWLLPFQAIGAPGQSEPSPVQRFRATVNEVLVPVTVTNTAGELVGDLALSEFRLFEDGKRQVVESVLNEETPLSLGLVIDLSGSMDREIEHAQMALSLLVDRLTREDRAFLSGFSDDYHVIQDLTSDRSRLQTAFSSLDALGNTALYDGIIEGLRRLKSTEGRRVLVVISDGRDNASGNTARRAIAVARASGIAVYALGLGERTRKRSIYSLLFPRARRVPMRGLDDKGLRELAESTGGRLLVLTDTRKDVDPHAALRDALDRLSQELRTMYVLAYRLPSHDLDGKWHRLRVHVTRPNLVVRFRQGYLAASPVQ